MRGALTERAALASLAGIIPADAGSTLSVSLSSPVVWDHPRGCGEHGLVKIRSSGPAGSSPRMRGAPYQRAPEPVDRRIIPADAGSTFCLSSTGPRSADHPRGCGEHLVPRPACAWWYGIIPADAGSTGIFIGKEPKCRDHPRGCGEHKSVMKCTETLLESSPRMRGAPNIVRKEDTS